MSRVFVAKETALDRKVVIKVLPPETAAQVSLERSKREVLPAAKLQPPHNVLLSGGSAMVTDFGVAKALSASTNADQGSMTSLGVALGTPAYMSPEQASADPSVDHRADIYSFGVLAYELLTGQPPFAGRTPQHLLAAHVTEAPEAITRRRASLPPALAALVMRCLEKRPADRPQSA